MVTTSDEDHVATPDNDSGLMLERTAEFIGRYAGQRGSPAGTVQSSL
jgi:hypothetical protein